MQTNVTVSNQIIWLLLRDLLEKSVGNIEVFCKNKDERCCDDGHCIGALCRKGGTYEIVTGIKPGVDNLGLLTFTLSDVKTLGPDGIVVVKGHHLHQGQDTITEMRLKPQK